MAQQQPLPSEITPPEIWHRRKVIMAGLGAGLSLTALSAKSADAPIDYPGPDWLQPAIAGHQADPGSRDALTPYDVATRYNNFYEFGTDKSDPAKNAQDFVTDPWRVTVSGAANNIGEFDLEAIIRGLALEERITRFRCVEAWSMVLPFIGVPLSKVLSQFDPTGDAKYVAFETLVDPEQMPGQRSRFSTIQWPYQEGLRMDEAMHDLCFLAVGMYGQALPPQNGAPVRLVVPWKYGFKSIKSIVSIRFSETQPATAWNQIQPQEYGFYSNVNPQVSHPRWSQASERVLTGSLFPKRQDTLMFNGYADEVASLYAGMDLKANF
ncbi:protein-methionine-sulfoxide reductase catalytic subunit MsrP [Litorivicinus lipolyticus]|uniref:Protein-methionine-sulfoxide reductase catalytic subunit MsrP n=1 Tax=Litorivicinus lipolyticus TaxID=418701 RepID=A0A5Q2QCN8_9GAMM|nr:protein-methionine-sulfoxide reductase catalytic subunit MsrP [Litorivicinus lipolyticus]QGG80884.1 protein-methionine-sulfoxide reductase catalytic subunit MsrP [Litorivicinus lipolyticus]